MRAASNITHKEAALKKRSKVGYCIASFFLLIEERKKIAEKRINGPFA